MDTTALAERLEQTIRDLGEHRQTHVVWRDWLLKDPANAAVNPHAGSADFHDDTIKDYDRHLANIREAAARLRAVAGEPATPVGGESVTGIVNGYLMMDRAMEVLADAPLPTWITKNPNVRVTIVPTPNPEQPARAKGGE